MPPGGSQVVKENTPSLIDILRSVVLEPRAKITVVIIILSAASAVQIHIITRMEVDSVYDEQSTFIHQNILSQNAFQDI